MSPLRQTRILKSNTDTQNNFVTTKISVGFEPFYKVRLVIFMLT